MSIYPKLYYIQADNWKKEKTEKTVYPYDSAAPFFLVEDEEYYHIVWCWHRGIINQIYAKLNKQYKIIDSENLEKYDYNWVERILKYAHESKDQMHELNPKQYLTHESKILRDLLRDKNES